MSPEKKLGDDIDSLISTLPRETGWFADIYEYEGVWYAAKHLEALISAQKKFHAQDSDIFLASHPKSGTTWLKAILFTLLNRERHPLSDENHPLLAYNPHDIVHFLERPLDYENKALDLPSPPPPSPRLFSTHLPHSFLPESVRNNPTCKVVYVGRNPKDTFVSFWHFCNKLRAAGMETETEMGPTSAQVLEPSPIGEMFDKFCRGASPYGPIWDHLLGYWEESKRNPNRVFFLKYEELSQEPAVLLRRLAEFLDCPFSVKEEESGLIDEILKFCSFEKLSSLEVNKSGKREFGVQKNNLFFRKGSVGDYKNHLSVEMVEKLDQITGDKFFGSGLNF